MKLILVGKSATGKDTVATALNEAYGYRRAESYTTRPKRTPDERGHHFVESAEGYAAVAPVKIQGYDYFLTKEEIDKSDVIIVEPSGIDAVCKAVPTEAVYVVYLKADREARKEQFLRRDPENGETTFEQRDKEDAERFAELERFIEHTDERFLCSNAAAIVSLENHYDEDSLLQIVATIRNAFVRHDNMRRIVDDLLREETLVADYKGDTGDEIRIRHTDDGIVCGAPTDVFSAICLSNESNRANICEMWLNSHHEPFASATDA